MKPIPASAPTRVGNSGSSFCPGWLLIPDRRMILLTATPHSGDEEAFSRLLSDRAIIRRGELR